MGHWAGDEIDINGTTITLSRRKGATGIRWTWVAASLDLTGQTYRTSPEEAIADAQRVLARPECDHGQLSFCPACHDATDR